MKIRRLWLALFSFGLIFGIAYVMNVWGPGAPHSYKLHYLADADEAKPGNHYTLADSSGRIILQTGLPVGIGDEFIDENNVRYRVSSMNGRNGTMVRVFTQPLGKKGFSALIRRAEPVQADFGDRPRVGIYCTHSDESYKPSQGSESERASGAIFRVAYSLASSMVEDGVIVDQSFATHDPHDINAYARSRRTMMQLLKKGPNAVFDIHRDSAPAQAYLTYITGVETAKVMIVVGRQNPNMNANLAFAEQVKERADEMYPGLIRGIFIGRGSYNQDLFPRALLFEIGTSELPEQYAQNAAHCLGDVISTLL